ncbi:Protein of unknown function [Gryllus bimaculatus]|nr:Protein of unknown function [Gryllus bimaculatus]
MTSQQMSSRQALSHTRPRCGRPEPPQPPPASQREASEGARARRTAQVKVSYLATACTGTRTAVS